MAIRASAICAFLLFLAAGCGGGSGDKSSNTGESGVCAQFGDAAAPRETKAPWDAPGDPMALTCAAGLVPEKAEFLQYHVHAHLDVFVDGLWTGRDWLSKVGDNLSCADVAAIGYSSRPEGASDIGSQGFGHGFR